MGFLFVILYIGCCYALLSVMRMIPAVVQPLPAVSEHFPGYYFFLPLLPLCPLSVFLCSGNLYSQYIFFHFAASMLCLFSGSAAHLLSCYYPRFRVLFYAGWLIGGLHLSFFVFGLTGVYLDMFSGLMDIFLNS